MNQRRNLIAVPASRTHTRTPRTAAFTLIELSIVLVIIGLIVGGVLVGQNLIAAAGVRGTISQIEKYQTAVNTFRDKYGGLPGDINASLASQFGFAARGTAPGTGDGNGVLEGVDCGYGVTCNKGYYEGGGETVTFWVDLSSANLIDGSFNTASVSTVCAIAYANPTGASVGLFFPQAKLGQGNYIYVWSGGYYADGNGTDNTNYYSISAVSEINGSSQGQVISTPGLTVQQAYSIDKKLDDGLPQSGNVMALYLNGSAAWAAGGGVQGAWMWGSGAAAASRVPTTAATPGSPTTCYDNGNIAGTQQYSLAQNGGANVNCALSFRFQ